MQDHVKRHGGKRRTLARCVVALVAAIAAFPSAAAAANCPDRPVSTVFAAWGDQSDYFLAPGGDFEGTSTSWSGGRLVGYTDPFRLSGPSDRQSLKLAPGESTTSPWFCADVRHPDFRFVARPLGRWSPGALNVHVRFHDRWGGIQTWHMWTLAGLRDWAVSPRIRLIRDLPLPDHGQTSVQLVFVAAGGEWAVDDVFIDPYRK